MRGSYTEKIINSEIPFKEIVSNIMKLSAKNNITIEQFCDSDINYERKYNVYKVAIDDKLYVLKKTDQNEIAVYENLLKNKSLPVPQYYGSTSLNNQEWLLIEFINGIDLRDFTEKMAYASAKSIAQIMNLYWQNSTEEFESNKVDNRFERYFKRINKRAECLKNENEIKYAYDEFIKRQLVCPRALCNGDFLQFNGLYNEDKVILIDWGFAGIMPYSLDIARLIAHGSEDKKGFPFYMKDCYRKIYIDEVYKQLENKPDREQYLLDIKLAELNEYIEFIEEELNNPKLERDEFFYDYRSKAIILAREIKKLLN